MVRTLIAVVLALMTPLVGMASVEDDPTSLSYISYLERYATVFPAGGDETLEAVMNMPLVAGDRIDTAREARVEAILADGTILWLDEYTTVSLDAVAMSRDTRGDQSVLFLGDGAIMLELPANVRQTQPTRIDGANETVYLKGPGVYRVEVLRSGGLWVEVWQGEAEALGALGGVNLPASSATEVNGGAVHTVRSDLTDRDDFARWVQARRGIGSGSEALYVDTRYSREASQLDAYGTWIYVDGADTWAWRPTVGVDWRPYTAGRWYWTSVGWTWLAYEPWGWLPYHYGTWWYSASHGWVWCWGRTWSPAWVHWTYGHGYVGWCPVGWYSSWWWNRGWDWDHHHHGGHGGPPRGDVVPGRSGHSRLAVSRDFVVDMEGRARFSSLDTRAWSIVSERDFASPRVGRIVTQGGQPLRTVADRNTMAAVTSKPLITASPRRVTPASELARVFEGRTGSDRIDLSRVVSRDSTMSEREALEVVVPRSAESIQNPSSSMRVTSPQVDRTPAIVAASPTRSERDSAAVTSSRRSNGGNFFRATSAGKPALVPVTGSSDRGETSRRTVGSSSAPMTRQPITPPARTSSPTSSRSSSDGAVEIYRNDRSAAPAPVTRESGGRELAPSSGSRSAPSSRSPVVVPRSSDSGGSSSSRSIIIPRTSSTSRSAPSPRATVPSSSRSSASSSRSSSGSSIGSSSRSSVSRSSSSRSSSARSSSSSTRSRSSSSSARSSGRSSSRSSSSSSRSSSSGRSSSSKRR